MKTVNYQGIPSPCFVLEESLLRRNLSIIQEVGERADVEVILAFKGFSMWSVFPVIREYVSGATASSLHELRLCKEEMKCKAHTYMVAYIPQEFDEIVEGSSHLTFNSLSQYATYKAKLKQHSSNVSFGLRVNPEYSEVETPLYDPSDSSSRLGVTLASMPDELPEGIEGLHFHVLCESDSFTLENTLEVFERRFGKFLPQIKWLNLGGGHLMTAMSYDVDHAVQVLKDFREKHGLKLILEPGSAFAWQTGTLLTTIIDIVENGGVKTAVIDSSFTCHMPDCLEMPYRPKIRGAYSEANQYKEGYLYRIGGLSCLAGDFMEEYAFKNALKVGDQLIFEDMMHYTMVKTTTFNGINHPSIGIWKTNNEFELIREFTYEDFKRKLS